MTTADRIWGYFLIAGGVVWAIYALRIWRRGWVHDEEDDKVYSRRDHPYSFFALQVLHVIGFVTLVFTGLGSLNGWK